MSRSIPRRRSPVGRYRDRSSSRERRRSPAYSDDDDVSYRSDYSDDFETESRSRQRTPSRKRTGNDRPRRRGELDSYKSSTSDLHSTSSKKTTQSVGRRTYVKPRRSNGLRSNYSDRGARPRHDVVAARLLSAKQRRINDVQNELGEAEQRLEDLLKENKILKTVQFRQDKALRKFEDVENDLPRLISQNFEEQKVLRARLRKAQDSEKRLNEKLRDNDQEMKKMSKALKKLKVIVEEKNLGERSDLARKLSNTENDLGVAERRVKELEKNYELIENSYKRQIRTERQKHKETQKKLDEMIEEHQSVVGKLKEKERALGVTNIYSLRNMESTSINSTPRKQRDTSVPSTTLKLAIADKESKQSKPAAIEFSSPEQSNRSKRDRVEQSLPSPRPPSPAPMSTSPISRREHKKAVQAKGVGIETKTVLEVKEKTFLTSSFKSDTPTPRDRVADSLEFEKTAEKSSPEPDSFRKPSKTLAEAVRDEDPYDESVLRRRAEEENVKLKKIEEEEMRRKEEQKREQERLAAEQQRKKAALLAKMRDIEQEDDSPRSPPDALSLIDSQTTAEATQIKNSVYMSSSETTQKSKADRVRSLLGTDTDPVVENLHLGIPTTVKRPVETSESDLSFGSYAPTAGKIDKSRKPRGVNKKPSILSSGSDDDEPLFDVNSGKANKDSDLLSQLFGDQAKSDKKPTTEQRNAETITPRAKPVHSGYPWEKNVVTSSKVNGNVNSNYKMKTGLHVNASTPIQDDDIEELSL